MSEWISVDDRLPEFEVPVLGCRRNLATQEWNYEACILYKSEDFDDPYWLYHSDSDIAEDVRF